MEQADKGKKSDWGDYFTKLENIFKECYRILKVDGRIVVNIQPLFSDYIPTHHIVSEMLRRIGFLFRNEILWEKNNYNAKYTAWGSWCSPSSPYLKYTWEFLEVFSKGSIHRDGKNRESDLTPEEFKEWTIARWSIAPERRMKDFQHDAMFPEELAKRVIKLFSFKGDKILDPFNGVGTTTKVAKNLDRDYIGIDINPIYCEKAKTRLEK
jgi:DNA modification methylase